MLYEVITVFGEKRGGALYGPVNGNTLMGHKSFPPVGNIKGAPSVITSYSIHYTKLYDHRLTGLERDKIIAEYNEILALIKRLKEILASEVEILGIIIV